ncbi:hypothetical protein P3X46_028711 [Hevea brasiliensis]|uniref:Thioredoxin domain-containing protein n=1 Tax=Hevea brasiliensis TaxID=3981 RepID=A0ABQ9KRB1_HEVBR|nr:hypothetical protein P3X46_028711 [Hevea brasiliensis]
MMGTRVWPRRIVTLLCVMVMIWGSLSSTAADPSRVSMCPRESVVDLIFGFLDRSYAVYGSVESPDFVGVTEGDEVSLQKALSMVYKNSHQYVAVLFYASWCPFSRTFRPSFSLLSSLFPSIPHFAIEESSIRPSILSKYGVHGFPTLFLLNSTMHDRYHGSRTLGSLVAFYTDVTGVKIASRNKGSLDKIFAWRGHIRNLRLGSFLEHPRAYLNGIIQVFNSLKEPCRKTNLQEGAMNARAWASKSLVTVSIGDASTSRGPPISECR